MLLIINVPPIRQSAPINTGVAYLKGFLDCVGIENSIMDFNDDYHSATELQNEFLTPEHEKTFAFIPSHKSEIPKDFLREQVNRFRSIIEESDTLAFSIFDNLTAEVFEQLYDIFKECGLLKGKEIILGGNFFLHYGNSEKYRELGKVCSVPIEEFFETDIEKDSYSQYIPESTRIPIIKYSSGCIYRCKFCPHHKLNNYKRYFRNDTYVLKEIIDIAKKGYSHFWLGAENIGNMPSDFHAFLKKLSIIYKGTWRANFSSPRDGLDYGLMKKAGCSIIMMGIESFSEKVRRDLNKPRHTNQELFEFAEEISKHKIRLNFGIITGFITETDDDFKEGLNTFKEFCLKFKDIVAAVDLYSYYIVSPDNHCGYDVQYDENGFWFYGENTYEVRQYRHQEYLKVINDIL